MLGIGRALMAGRELLVLDEPSFGLAPLIVAEIGRIVESINRDRASPCCWWNRMRGWRWPCRRARM